MDLGRVVDGKDVGPGVDRKHQLGAAEHDGIDPAFRKLGDQGLELALAVADDLSSGELLEDDAVDLVDPLLLDRDERDPAILQPAAEERLGHGEARAEQGDPLAAVGNQSIRRRIGDAVADRLVTEGRSRVALLGTRFTMMEPHVRSRLESRGISLVPIEPGWIHEVNRIIFEELAAGRVVRDSQRKLKTLITELAKLKAQAVVLGCTELVLAVDVRANVLPVYDSTAIHARAALDWMLAEEEQARAAA